MTLQSNQVRPVPALTEPRAAQETVQPRATNRRTIGSFVPPNAPTLAVQGKYSIERLLALEKYSRTKSHWHLLWVVIWIPLAPVLIILVYQLPRLAPPDAGLKANWVYVVVRGGVGIAMLSECCVKLVRTIAPELDTVLTMRMGLLYDVYTGVVYMALMVAFATIWGFPVPFGPSIINPITSVISISALYRVVRPLVRQSRETKHRFMICVAYAVVFSFASLAYPAYMALFFAVGEQHPRYQPLVTFLIPVMKLLMRKMMAHAARELEDLVPVVVIFSVEFFSSLYQVMSVQTGSSMATTGIIVAIDLVFAVRSQWKLHERTKTLRDLLKETQAEALLPALAAAVCGDLQALQSSPADERHLLKSIRLYSAVPNDVATTEDLDRLERINRASVFSSTRWNPIPRQAKPRPTSSRLASGLVVALRREIQPGDLMLAQQVGATTTVSSSTNRTPIIAQDKQSTVVIEATAMLFRSELLLLAEYLECVIPLFYTGNTLLLWLSPNGSYDPRIGSISTADELHVVVLNIAALFTMEVVSFVLLNWMLHKRMHFSPLHQLGFVLEHQAPVIRANMLFILIMSLQFNLDHAGTDFSFQFKWLHARHVTS